MADQQQLSTSGRDLPRTVGFWGGIAVMVGIIIGSGIFRTPTEIASHLTNPWIVLAFWGAGGIIALCGSLTYAELASMYPESGGVYVFLREGYGRPLAFVFGWTYMLIVKPSGAAGIAVVFGENINALFGLDLSVPAQTVGILIVLTTINVLGTWLSTRFAMALTAIKFGALVMLVLLALGMNKGSVANFSSLPATESLWKAIVPVMAAVMWTYDGWSDVGAIAGEVKTPQKTLPRIFITGILATMGLYLAVNAMYLWMIPLPEQAAQKTLATSIMNTLLGPSGAIALTVLVLVSTLGSTHSSVMTGARVTYQQARDGLLFAWLGTVHPKFNTPSVGLWVQCTLSCIAVLTLKSFGKLTGTFMFTMWIFYGLAGAVIFLLRFRRPDAARAFRCIGYPIVPAIFVGSAIFMTVLAIVDDPLTTSIWLGVLAAGFPVYYIWNWQKQSDPR